MKTGPWFVLTYGAQIVRNVLNPRVSAALCHDGGGGRFGPGGENTTFTTYNVTVPQGLAIMVLYFAVTAILGLVLFERKGVQLGRTGRESRPTFSRAPS